MNNEEMTQFIVRELSRHHDRGEIVRRLCEASQLNWKEAESMVASVEAQNRRQIAGRQTPLLVFFSIGTLLIGLALLAYNVRTLIGIYNADLIDQVLRAQSGYYSLAGLVTGVGMTIGGLYGSWKVLAAFFPE